MRHQRKGRKFKRVRSQRRAFLRTILGSFIMHEKINTTEAKAKEVKMLIDRLINKAKKAQDEVKKVAIIRDLKIALPAMAVKKMIGEEFIKRFANRNSGYARVIKLAPRKSDNAKIAIVELVD